jgi:serine protease
MRPTAKLLICVGLLCTMSLVDLQAQQTRTLNGKQYALSNGRWYQVERSKRYEVNTSVITVKIKSNVTASQSSVLNASQGAQVLRSNILGYTDLRIAVPGDVFQVAQNYINSGLVESAEVNTYGVYVSNSNDTHYSSQWNLNQGSDADIDMPEAWNIASGSSAIIIGILDSGTDWTHEDLGLGTDNYQNIWLNPGEDVWAVPNDPSSGNHADDDGNGLVDDWKGYDFYNGDNDSRGPYFHGTHVAGIAAAKTNNSKGIAGIAGGWNAQGARLMVLGVGDYSPDGSVVDDAILYAANKGARVITMSLSVGQADAIDDALETANQSYGCFIDCSAGNEGGSVTYPATNQYVVAVSATDQNDGFASFSNYGSEISVSAPGVGIYSTQPGNSYDTDNGTSFSAPQVAGLAALVLSLHQSLSPDQVRKTIELSADDLGSAGFDNLFGFGRINTNKAVRNLYVPDVYPTVSSALSAASAGMTVFVASGSHSVGSNVTVGYGVLLQISSGATLSFTGNYKLRVEGKLVATGASFTRSGGQWYGIEFYGAPAGSEISGCTIQNAQYGVSVISSNSFYTQWCTIQNSTTGVYSSGGDVA